MFAHVLKSKGYKNSKIVVLDPEAELLQAGAVPGRLGEALPGHGRMAGPEDARRHQGRRPEDRRGEDRSRQLQGGARQRHPGADGGQDRARCRARRPVGLLPDRPREHEVEDGRQRLRGRRRLHPGRHAEVGVLRQQPGQGRGDDDRRRARRHAHLPGALFQHLLEPDRHRRRREGRRHLRAGRRQAQGGHHVRQPEGRGGRPAQAELQGIGRLVHGIVADVFG